MTDSRHEKYVFSTKSGLYRWGRRTSCVGGEDDMIKGDSIQWTKVGHVLGIT